MMATAVLLNVVCVTVNGLVSMERTVDFASRDCAVSIQKYASPQIH